MIQVVLAEQSHLLKISSKRDNFCLLFQKPWVSSLRVPRHQWMIFDLWEEIIKGTNNANSFFLPNTALSFTKEDCLPVHILHFRSKM